MTARKHLKQRVRERMAKTGERYAAARRQIIRPLEHDESDSAARWHMPGNVPATTALRILLAHAGVRAPHTGAPFSEAMLFGIAGGIAIGVFAFYYEREDSASFFIAGRHAWYDDLAYLRGAFECFGSTPMVQESGGTQAAARQLHDALGQGSPCVLWVDAAGLPHRAMPSAWSGGGYHVISAYRIDEAAGTALIGDLSDEPIEIALADLARARARIAKQRNRLLTIAPTQAQPELEALVRSGLERCHHGLLHPTLPGAQGNARLEALRTWAERMHGSRAKERWERVFRPGANLWSGLCAIYDFIEHYGTGGGLCRPLFADFLSEAAAALGRPALGELAERYAELGSKWSDLAEAALPGDVPALREARELHARKAELLASGAPAHELHAVWQRLDELAQQAAAQFPLAESACAELRAGLRERILALYAGEVAAHAALVQLLSA